MKIKVSLLVLAAICAAALCVRLAQSTVAQDLPTAAKGKACIENACSDPAFAQAAFEAKHYDQTIECAKRVLFTSTDSDDRIKAYTLLISSVRASQGYDAAIKRCENVYAFAKKSNSTSKELASISLILADLKHRRKDYERTIAQQQLVIKAHPGSDRAGQAALKAASCKQALGPREEAIKAYVAVIRDYPLTRSGWKAAQELAWMRQSKDAASAVKSSELVSISLSDGLQALKEGRLSEAEKTARMLLFSSDAAVHSGALDLLIESLARSSGTKVAAKQAWQLACGTKEFEPTYSDVLRLEACVADLDDQSVPAKENVAEEKSDAKKTDVVAETSSEMIDNANADTTLSTTSRTSPRKSAPIVQASVPQGQIGLGRMPAAAWPGTGVGNGKKTSRPKTVNPSPRVEQPVTAQPEPNQPTNPSPVQPTPGDMPVKIGDPQPIPYFDQWTCSKEYEEAGDDLEKIRGLIEEHIEKAQNILLTDGDIRLECRGLGVVLGCAMCAFDKLEDKDWALGICDEYVLPHIEAAGPESYKYLAKPLVKGRVVRMWVAAQEYDRSIETLKQMLDEEPNAREADATRVRLAQVCDLAGKYEEAIAYLKEIDDNGDLAGAKQYIPELEKKMEAGQ